MLRSFSINWLIGHFLRRTACRIMDTRTMSGLTRIRAWSPDTRSRPLRSRLRRSYLILSTKAARERTSSATVPTISRLWVEYWRKWSWKTIYTRRAAEMCRWATRGGIPTILKSRIRCCIEHIFGHRENSMGGLELCYIGLARNAFAIGLSNLAYNMKRFI